MNSLARAIFVSNNEFIRNLSVSDITEEIILSQLNHIIMKNVIFFIIRIIACILFHWLTYYRLPAQASFFLTPQARIILSPKATVSCHSITWLGDAMVCVGDSSSMCIYGSIFGTDSNSRFFTLGNNASIKRKIDSLSTYVFPIGYYQVGSAYRGFTLDMKSLGQTGQGFVSVQLLPHVQGVLNYEKYFPATDPSCAAGSWIAFNCLSPDGWHCDGPSDYEYVVSTVTPDYCGGVMKRVIKTSTGSNNWQDSIESVVGDLGENFCQYSNWNGGHYRDFSDFALASHTSLLPVTFVDVQANPLNQKCIRVSWTTVTESNNDKFFVARGTDGSSFKIIGEEVLGSGNATTPHHYYFDDCDVVPNTDYYYMVQQVDYDGVIDWSDIVSAKIEKEEVLETRIWNLLGQEISENTPGIQIVQITTKSGSACSKIFKPLP